MRKSFTPQGIISRGEVIGGAQQELKKPVGHVLRSGSALADIECGYFEGNFHPNSDLNVVMKDVFEANDEQAYSFFNEGQFIEQAFLLDENFLPGDSRSKLIYAIKANPLSRAISLLGGRIDGFDCASLGEIELILNLTETSPDSLYFNNPIRTDRETKAAHEHGVRSFTVQCRKGVQQVLAFGNLEDDLSQIAVRIETPNDDADIQLSSKFGCELEEGIQLLRLVEEGGCKKGLTMHTGSQNRSPKGYQSGLSELEKVAIEAGGVSSINLGGGLPVNYFSTDHYDLGDYFKFINLAISQLDPSVFTKSEEQPQIIIEPGRAMIAGAIDLAVPVLNVHERRGERRIFMGDGIYTSFSDAKIHGWKYDFKLYRTDGRTSSSSSEKYTLHGRTCDGGDTLGEIELPFGVQKGDYLCLRNAGAYLVCQSTRFNGYGPPKNISYNIVS